MNNIKVNDKVVWHDGNGNDIAKGTIVGVKYKGSLGTIFKVQIYTKTKEDLSMENKNIHQKFLRKI